MHEIWNADTAFLLGRGRSHDAFIDENTPQNEYTYDKALYSGSWTSSIFISYKTTLFFCWIMFVSMWALCMGHAYHENATTTSGRIQLYWVGWLRSRSVPWSIYIPVNGDGIIKCVLSQRSFHSPPGIGYAQFWEFIRFGNVGSGIYWGCLLRCMEMTLIFTKIYTLCVYSEWIRSKMELEYGSWLIYTID